MRRIANILREWDWFRIAAVLVAAAALVVATLSGSLVALSTVLIGIAIGLVLLSLA